MPSAIVPAGAEKQYYGSKTGPYQKRSNQKYQAGQRLRRRSENLRARSSSDKARGFLPRRRGVQALPGPPVWWGGGPWGGPIFFCPPSVGGGGGWGCVGWV